MAQRSLTRIGRCVGTLVSSRVLIVLQVFATLLLVDGAAEAQVLTGTVTDAEAGTPLSGAFVRAFDPSGERVAGVLTSPFGRYALTLPGPGTYTAQVELIGRATADSGPLVITEGAALEWSPVLSSQAIQILGIEVEGGRRCTVRPDEGTLVARVWDEARKALEVAAWAEGQDLFRYRLRGYERELDRAGAEIADERSEIHSGYLRTPYTSKPAESLVEFGFVQETDDGAFAYAPDSHVLLSDDFLDSHCLSLARQETGQVGLGFEPTRDRGITDIRGVMWLDSETAELTSVSYSYVGFPGVDDGFDLGGQVQFERLPSGAWIVRSWSLDLPILGEVLGVGGATPDRRIIGVLEKGGEVLTVLDQHGRTLFANDRAILAGTVFDSIRGHPLPDAEVIIRGTNHRATTGPDGEFLMPDLPRGRYRVGVEHPRLDSLGLPVTSDPISLALGETTWLAVGVPTVVQAESTRVLDVEVELRDSSPGPPRHRSACRAGCRGWKCGCRGNDGLKRSLFSSG